MKIRSTQPMALAAIVLLFAAGAIAQPPAFPEIQVTGEASRDVEPDQAEVDVAVVSQAQSAQEAAEINAGKVDAVLRALRDLLGPEASLETVNYHLQPNYQRSRDGSDPVTTSYTAPTVVRVTKLDVNVPGRVIDAAIEAGANRVERLDFTVKDSETERLFALAEASRQARRKAGAIAEALGLEITGILSATEDSPVVMHPRAASMGLRQAEAAVDTPLVPGAVQIRAQVSLRVRVSPR